MNVRVNSARLVLKAVVCVCDARSMSFLFTKTKGSDGSLHSGTGIPVKAASAAPNATIPHDPPPPAPPHHTLLHPSPSVDSHFPS